MLLKYRYTSPKKIKGAAPGKAPSKIVPVHEKRPVNFVNAVPIYMGKQVKKRQFEQHQQVTKPDKQNQEGE